MFLDSELRNDDELSVQVEEKEAVQDGPVDKAEEVKKAEQEEPSEAEEGPKESTGEKKIEQSTLLQNKSVVIWWG